MLLARLLKDTLTQGCLRIIDAGGRMHVFGEASSTPRAMIRLHKKSLHNSLFFNPKLRLGEAYMNGTLTIEDGTLYDFLEICVLNAAELERRASLAVFEQVSFVLRRLQQANPIAKARANVAPHYDISDTVADLFLDADRLYSCAYYLSSDFTLEEAQAARKRHIAAKLLLEPGQKVLEIGCGWGGLALTLAKTAGVEVTGLTLSPNQHAYARRRAEEAGLADQVRFELRDYREQTGRFDRIVSVGMFEHVGAYHYEEYFSQVKALLAEDGVMLLNAIGRMEPPGTTTAWTRKYIFPGGYVPALSEVLAAIEKTGLWATDSEIDRIHYADTFKAWREKFAGNRARALERHDERFCRMWEFYLTVCDVAFRHLKQMNFEIQIAPAIDTVPLTRRYIECFEAEHPLEDYRAV
jgi:cyclopropane-fatty-acyl-phospholipid synthase